MCNVVFIDFKVLLEGNILRQSSIMPLKEAVSNLDNIRIVCITPACNMQSFSYNSVVSSIADALSIDKCKCFDDLHVASSSEICGRIESWLSVNEVKSFAIVLHCPNEAISKAYANNTLCYNELNENGAKNVRWILSNYTKTMPNDNGMFITSDTHFSHANIIRYCNRPWNSGRDSVGNIIVTDNDVKRMDDELVSRWNSVVSKNSIVWHLGDFSFGGKEAAERIFPQLNGKINLVMGNHDRYKLKWYYELGFNRVYDRKVVIDDFVILSHAPLMFLNENCPFYNIFGHVHDSPAYPTWSKTGCCACVERHDYYPVPWSKVKEMYNMMNSKENADE